MAKRRRRRARVHHRRYRTFKVRKAFKVRMGKKTYFCRKKGGKLSCTVVKTAKATRKRRRARRRR